MPFWVDESRKLAIVPRPRPDDWLEDDLRALHDSGVDVLVSLLTVPEQKELGLVEEAVLCQGLGIRYINFPISDRETPESIAAVRSLIGQLRSEQAAGRSIATHCRASIGRSSLILACLLCEEGDTPAEAFAKLTRARGAKVPDTEGQVAWVERYADLV